MTTIVATLDKNADLTELQGILSDLADELSRAQEQAQDPDTIKELGIEIREVGFRATNLQQVLFAQQTQKIADAVAKVQENDAAVKEAIDNIADLNKFIKTISSFLGLVDKVIDLAKLV